MDRFINRNTPSDERGVNSRSDTRVRAFRREPKSESHCGGSFLKSNRRNTMTLTRLLLLATAATNLALAQAPPTIHDRTLGV